MATVPVLGMGLGVVLDLQWVVRAPVANNHSAWVARVRRDPFMGKKAALRHQVTISI